MNSVCKIILISNLNLQHCANGKLSRFTAKVIEAWVLASLLLFA